MRRDPKTGLVLSDGVPGLRCDAFGCDEWHPLEHECLGEPGFGTGRWLGWVYLDVNRPDLFPRVLRFCSVRHLQFWTEDQVVDRQSPTRHGSRYREDLPTALDDALRRPENEIARQAGLRALKDGKVGSAP